MGIADDIKKLGEDIVASYDTRVKAIGVLVKDTHQMLKRFDAEHKEMSEKQAEALANFVADLTKSVSNMIKGFQKDHKAMADELKDNLEKGEEDRIKAFKAMMANIQKEIKAIETYVKNKLKEFDDAHADMSEELKKMLAKYVDDMVKATKKLMDDIQKRQKERNTGVADLLEAYNTEREKMAANWQGLVATMAKRRGGKPVVSAGAEVKTVEEAVKKPKKKGKGKKRGRKKK
jgi:gas vesicle protein